MKQTISNIAYKFQADGVIIPVLQLTPGIETTTTVFLSNKTALHKDINRSDVVDIEINEYNQVTKITPIVKGELNKPLKSYECPVCNTKLLPSNMGIGRCVNRNCKAQIPKNILILLSSLNFNFKVEYNRILDNLFIRGAIHSLEHIFYINAADFAFSNIPPQEICDFLTTIHKLRGNVNILQLLTGLFTGSDYTTLQHIADVYAEKNLNLTHCHLLSDPQFLKSINVTCPHWHTFISVPENSNSLTLLGYLLHQ